MKNSSIFSGASLAVMAAMALAPFVSYAQIDINLDAGATTSIDSDTSASSEGLLDIELEATTSADVGATVEGVLDGDFRVNEEGIAVAVAEEVRTESDLEIFAANIAVREENVEEVTFDSQATGAWETKVVYEHQGKLFGL